MREYQNRRRGALRAELISLLGGKCARCEATGVLQFDHIDPKTKLFPIADGLDKPRAILLQEVAKCQLLCVPHHTEKNIEDGTYLRGEQVWTAKLTADDVRDIRSSTASYSQLMETYSITRAHVSAIRRRRAWKHVDLSLPGYSSGQRGLTVNQLVYPT